MLSKGGPRGRPRPARLPVSQSADRGIPVGDAAVGLQAERKVVGGSSRGGRRPLHRGAVARRRARHPVHRRFAGVEPVDGLLSGRGSRGRAAVVLEAVVTWAAAATSATAAASGLEVVAAADGPVGRRGRGSFLEGGRRLLVLHGAATNITIVEGRCISIRI